jgi:hypothetical protein
MASATPRNQVGDKQDPLEKSLIQRNNMLIEMKKRELLTLIQCK